MSTFFSRSIVPYTISPTLSAGLLVSAICGFITAAVSLIPVPMLYFYDDGVYFSSAQLVASEARPYSDFYHAHPPGTVWMNAIAVRAGAGVTACRAIHSALAVAFVVLLYSFLKRVDNSGLYPRLTALLGVLFLSATNLFREAASQIHTQLPGMLAVLIGLFLLLPGRPRPYLAGLFLAFATIFRVQFVLLGPAFIIFILATYGWRYGRGLAIRLTISSVFVSLAFHGAMEITHDNYFECIVRSHLTRAKTPIGDKVDILNGLFREPQVALGLIASAVLACSGKSVARGLAGFTILGTVLILLGSRFLADGYFLPIFPYFAACGAVVLARVSDRETALRSMLLAAAFIVVLCGVPMCRITYYRWTTQRVFELDLISRVGSTPGHTVACTPSKIPYFAGKGMVSDYLCPDTTSPISHNFTTWFLAIAKRSDIILITDTVIVRLNASACRSLESMRKPIVFATPNDKVLFHLRLAENSQ